MTRIKDALDAVAAAIIAQKDYLCSLDAKTGDGDHGLNMARGFSAVQDAVDEMADTTKPGPVLETIGQTLIENVGGAAGPLYGTGFLKAAKACDDDTLGDDNTQYAGRRSTDGLANAELTRALTYRY